MTARQRSYTISQSMIVIALVLIGPDNPSAKGSVIRTKSGSLKIPIAKPKQIVDPTGAGDAYRAGILKCLMHRWPMEKTGRVAALAAVYALESYGAQEHSHTRADFRRRYRENFKEDIEL
mgnify:CR=1 FL=1